MRLLLALAAGLALLHTRHSPVSALNNGLALTPPMGWSTWNSFRCAYDESTIRSVADSMVSQGFLAAGYEYLNLDDCWEGERTADGTLTYNTTMFPSGMKALVDYVHSKGLKFGIYSSSGPKTCEGFPGSWQHEAQDAKLFASWNVDFVKLDCCYQDNVADRNTAYISMSQALSAAPYPILFSCDTDELINKDNNVEFPYAWAPPYCNMARIWWDGWDAWQSTLMIMDHAANINGFSRPGYWNDYDILTIGMGAQTFYEYRTQMSIWSVAASPLLIGFDIRNVTQDSLTLLMNQEVIAINQDPVGLAGNMITRALDGTYEVWSRVLYDPSSMGEDILLIRQKLAAQGQQSNVHPWLTQSEKHSSNNYSNNRNGYSRVHDISPLHNRNITSNIHAVVLFNRANFVQNITLNFEDLFGNKLCCITDPPHIYATVRDVWNGVDLGNFTDTFTAVDVEAHDSVMLRVTQVAPFNS